MSMENHGEMISTEETPDSSTRAVRKSYHESHLVKKSGEPGEEISRHGASGFTSHPKEGVCGYSSPLEIHSMGRVGTRES
jgi:hypothetical protein